MKKLFFILFIFILFIFILFLNSASATLKWPIDSPVFTSHFGESRKDHWHNGVDIVSGNVYQIKSPANGELIFYRDEADSALPDRFGMGNLTVLQHDNDLRTIYYHIEAGTIVKNKIKFTPDDTIAMMGNSGRSSGTHLHLTIYSMKNDRVLNPVDYFAGYEDKKKPVIQKILLKGPLSKYVNIFKHKKIRKKTFFRVIVVANDVREGPSYVKAPVGARNIKLFIDGKLVKKIDFKYLEIKNKKYCLNGNPDISFKRTYLELPYYIDMAGFSVTKKTHKFKVIVTDNSGHTKAKTIKVRFY